MASKWDDTVASVANRETSPTAQVPKLFRRIYATASGESDSAPVPHAALVPAVLVAVCETEGTLRVLRSSCPHAHHL